MKHILLLSFLSLIFSMGTQAQTIAVVNDSAIDGCEKNGGKMTNFSAGKCDYKRCVYSDNKSDGKFYRVGDNSKTNCTDAELKSELERIGTGLNITINTTGGAAAGTPSGAQSGAQSGASSGAQSGSASGAQSGAQAGASSGSQSGAAGGVSAGGPGTIHCEWAVTGVIPGDHACAKACRKNFWGTEGTDRKKCRECLEKWSIENGGDLVLNDNFWSTVPGGRPNRSSVKIPGVQVRTGEIICYDANGNVVSRTGMGPTGCPSGSSTTRRGTVVINPNSPNNSGPGTSVVVTSSTSTPALPKECSSTKKKDITYCENWMRLNARYACASSSRTADCIGRGTMNDIESRHSGECTSVEECREKYRTRNNNNSWTDVLTGALVAGGSIASSLITGNAYVKATKANAEACNLSKQAYLDYTVSQETAIVTPDQFAALGCNGYGNNQFAGLGGAGLGGWGGSGYSPLYLGGMIGPYGGYNPYGGGAIGGAVGGFTAGGYINGGAIAGQIGGIQGGYINGGQIGGYINGGAIAGQIGGYINGGIGGFAQGGYINGGQIGGYINGGAIAGQIGGYAQGGYINGGIGGYAQGGYINGGAIAGQIGGYAQGGYINGGIGGVGGYAQGGYINGGQIGGTIGGLYVAGGMNGGGFPGGYPSGFPGGGWGSGVGGGVQGNYWAASQQTSNYDRMLQGQGISYQMGMGSGGYGGGFGSAGFNPMNAGGAFNASFNAGFF